MRDLSRVEGLLHDLFTSDELLRLLMVTPETADVPGDLPQPSALSTAEYMHQVAMALERRLVWRPVFREMVRQRERRASEIATVAADFGEPISVSELQVELAKEQKEAIQHLEARAADFVTSSKKELGDREVTYRRTAYLCYSGGGLAVVAGAMFAVWRATTVQLGLSNTNGWILAEVAILSTVAVGLIYAVANYFFMLGKSFMVESIKNADRSHAISFGEFYLRAYGSSAKWEEIKEAFQHWNIGDHSSFKDQTVDSYDPKLLRLAIDLAKLMPGAKKE